VEDVVGDQRYQDEIDEQEYQERFGGTEGLENDEQDVRNQVQEMDIDESNISVVNELKERDKNLKNLKNKNMNKNSNRNVNPNSKVDNQNDALDIEVIDKSSEKISINNSSNESKKRYMIQSKEHVYDTASKNKNKNNKNNIVKKRDLHSSHHSVSVSVSAELE